MNYVLVFLLKLESPPYCQCCCQQHILCNLLATNNANINCKSSDDVLHLSNGLSPDQVKVQGLSETSTMHMHDDAVKQKMQIATKIITPVADKMRLKKVLLQTTQN